MNLIHFADGQVFHERHGSIQNKFTYPLGYLYFRVDQASALQQLLNKGSRRFMSFHEKDYLEGKSGELSNLILRFLKERCGYSAEEVWLHTMPRMFGYGFNPVSFWICRRNGKIDAVLSEVNNTFGERHFYWTPSVDGELENSWVDCKKVFHVSPFMAIEGSYRFRFTFKPGRTSAEILYVANDGTPKLTTWIKGTLSNLETRNGFKILLRYGWMTPLVVGRIHYQALKLFLKKARFYSKPALPREEVSR